MKSDFFKTFIKYISIGILSFVIMLNFTSVSFISYADTQSDYDENNRQLDNLKKEQAALSSELGELNSQLETFSDTLNLITERMASKQQEIDILNQDISDMENEKHKQYEAMKLRIKFMYEEGDTSVLETLVSAKDFSDLVNKAEYVQNVHSYDRKMLEEYVATKQQVQDLKSTLETEMDNLENMQAEFESDKENLDATLASKQDELGSLDEQLQAAAEKAAEEQRRQEEAQQANNNNNSSNNNNSNKKPSGGGGGGSNPSYEGQGNTAVAQKIVQAAYSQLGVPYVWGGTQPGVGLDCSGLVQYCHAVAGISLPHYSESQYAGGRKVSSPEPGDICWKPGHVGIYIGGGMMIEAQQTGTNIMISPVRAPGYARYW